MAGSVLSGRCLYGAECHYITEQQLALVRRIMLPRWEMAADGDQVGPACWRRHAVSGDRGRSVCSRIGRRRQKAMLYRMGIGLRTPALAANTGLLR